MTMIEALWRELRDARMAARDVFCIRVTEDAIPGSATAAPLTPERARATQKLMMTHDGTVIPSVDYERLLEILVHPEDWATLLKEKDTMEAYAVQIPTRPGEPTRVLGIPVVDR